MTVKLEAADQRLAKKNAKVTVTLPDDKTVEGWVDKVSTVIVPAAAQNEEPRTEIEVIVAVDNQSALADVKKDVQKLCADFPLYAERLAAYDAALARV